MDTVSQGEIVRVKINLASSESLLNVLDRDWVETRLLDRGLRYEKHELFWVLLDESKCRALDKWIFILRSTLIPTQFRGIMNKLQESSDEVRLFSLLPEIEVLAYYMERQFRVEYEPTSPGKGKIADLKVSLDSQDVFMEVTRLFPSAEERARDILEWEVGRRINGFEVKVAGRLKSKMLDEIEQLPEDEFNALVLDISYHFADFDHVEEAFAGQLYLRIEPRSLEATRLRRANGVIHMPEGSKVGLVIAFKLFDYENRRMYLNQNAKHHFADQMIALM